MITDVRYRFHAWRKNQPEAPARVLRRCDLAI